MEFTKESRIVKDYLLLIRKGYKVLKDVPNLFNLIEVIELCLAEQEV